MRKQLLLFSFLLLLPLQAFAVTNITSCQTLNDSGLYHVTQNIDAGTGTCITVNNESVIIDCLDYNITFSGTSNSGIFMDNYDNITVQNCNIYQNNSDTSEAYGINFDGGSDITVENTYVEMYSDVAVGRGMWFRDINNLNVLNNEYLTHNDYSNALTVYDCDNVVIFNNDVTVENGSESEAFFLELGENFNISYNTINTDGYFITDGASIRLWKINNSDVHDNFINNTGDYNVGIFIFTGDTTYYYNSTITNNEITTAGEYGYCFNSEKGIALTIQDNTCSTNNSRAYGMRIWGTNNTIIQNNTVNTDSYIGYGIFYYPEDDIIKNTNHTVSNNRVTTTGNFSHGIYNIWNDNMTAYNNTVSTTGYASRGIRYVEVVNGNISYNDITTTHTSSHGVYLQQGTENYTNTNIWVGYNTLNVTNTGSTAILSLESTIWEGMYGKNVFTKNTVIDNGVIQLELDGYNNHTEIIDQNIKEYYFTNALFSVENTTYGLINYTSLVTADGSSRNFEDDVVLMDNYVFVNSTVGLNASANVTLYNIGDRGFLVPVILKDGVECGDCVNYTNLDATNVKFSVTGFSEYEIGDACGDATCEGIENCNNCAVDCACSGDNTCAWSQLLETFTCQGTYSNIGNQVSGFIQGFVFKLIQAIIALAVVGILALTINEMIRGTGKV